jgi:hypothetical protein
VLRSKEILKNRTIRFQLRGFNRQSRKSFAGLAPSFLVYAESLFEIAVVLVRLDHVARVIVNTDQSRLIGSMIAIGAESLHTLILLV